MSKCPCCNSDKIYEIINIDRYTVFKCKFCKLIFSTPFPTNEELNVFYQGFLFNPPNFNIREKLIRTKMNYLQNIFNIENKNSARKTFLDYGGGTGLSFKAATELGLDSYYFDLDKEAIKFVRENFNLSENNLINDLKYCNITFDFILSDNVIEHVTDPKTFITDLYNKLNKNGILVIKTPNAGNTDFLFYPFSIIPNYFIKILKYNSILKSINAIFNRYWHCEPPRHIYSFSKRSIEEICTKINLPNKTVHFKYKDISLYKNSILEYVFIKRTKISLLKKIILLSLIPFEFILKSIQFCLRKLHILSKAELIIIISKSKE